MSDDLTKDLNVGEYIKYLRERVGLTQKQLAESAGTGVHPQLVSNIERGVSLPSDKLCTALALYFNLPDKNELIIRKVLQKTPPEARGKVSGAGQSPGGAVRRVPILNPRFCTLEHMMTATDFSHEAVASSIAYSEVKDPKAFGLYVQDQANHPKVDEGDLVIFGPGSQVVHGDLCLVIALNRYQVRVFQHDPAGVLFRCYDPNRPVDFLGREDYRRQIDGGHLRVFPALVVIKTVKKG